MSDIWQLYLAGRLARSAGGWTEVAPDPSRQPPTVDEYLQARLEMSPQRAGVGDWNLRAGAPAEWTASWSSEQQQFAVVLAGHPSPLRFPKGEGIEVMDAPVATGIARLVMRSVYPTDGATDPNPLLLIDAYGPAVSLPEAVHVLWSGAAVILPIMSTAFNVSVPDLRVVLAYDRTVGRTQHEFVQFDAEEHTSRRVPGRMVPIDLVEPVVSRSRVVLGEDYVHRAMG
jgi:hypothetical protein